MTTSVLNRFWKTCFAGALALGTADSVLATPYTTTVPNSGLALPTEYPEAGGVVIVLTGANGQVYYQFSDPQGAFQGFNNNGDPQAFEGNPFTINNPLTLDCGFTSCTDYFGGSIARMDVRFSAYDGDTQPGGFDENDINLLLNGFDLGSWSGIQTELTNDDGTTSFGFTTGFGNNTFNTAWFESTDPALLNNILTTGQMTTQVFDADPNDNYWDFRRGPSLAQEELRTVAPGLEFEKTLVGGSTTFAAVGDVLNYEYEVTNIGSVRINDIMVTDDKIPNVMCPPPPNNSLDEVPAGSPSPNSFTCTGTYIVTQADVDAGTLTNIATADGDPEFGELGAIQDTVTLTGPTQTNSMTLDKVGSPSPFGAVGSTVNYTFTITNTGNTTLTNVVVTDPLVPSLSCNIASIEPLSAANPTNTATCTAAYTITQADVDAFAINGTQLINTANGTADAPDGSTVTATGGSAIDGQPAAPAMSLVKTAVQADFDAVGDVLDFQIAITNTGNVTWPGPPAITDALTGGASCPAGAVAPGATVTCTASYTIQQSDLDAGSVLNEASAEITVGGQTASDAGNVTVDAVITPSMTILKQLQAGSPSPYTAVGDSLVYEYVLTNTGNVSLDNFTITDDQVTATCPAGPIAPNASITCTSAPYVIDQNDLNNGSVTNVANGDAQTPGGDPVASPTTTLTVQADQQPAMDMVKTAPPVTPIQFVDGFVITYIYDVTNTGNVTLAGPIDVVDDKIGAPFECTPGPLAPGAAVQCSATYTVTQADVQNGFVTNNAFATDGTTQSNSDSATVPQSGTPALDLVKTATSTDFTSTSDVLSYSFEIINTGDVTLSLANNPITINDPDATIDAGCTQPPLLYPVGSANTPQSYTCTATFNGLTQADLDAGEFTNTADASFPYTPPASGTPTVVSSAPTSATVTSSITPMFTFTKSSTDDYSNVGDVVTYTFTAENLTNQTITSVDVVDPLLGGAVCTISNIGPLATGNCTGTYSVTQADLDRGFIDNSADATATSPTGLTVTETDTETVSINPAAQIRSLDLTKTATPQSFSSVGDVIDFVIEVENTGNLTLENIVVNDPDLGLTCAIATLAPLASDNSCTGSYTITQADIDNGGYTNTATATANGVPPQPVSETVSGPARVASFDFSKSFDAPFTAVGDQVRFTLRVENTGNVTLNNVVLNDPFFDPDLVCNIGSLAPGAVDTSCFGDYIVDQDDVDAGSITNAATLDATAVGQPPLSGAANVTVPGPARQPAMVVTKSEADGSGDFANLPTTETYTFTVENTGNVRLSNIVLTDALTGFSCPIAPLDPGQTATTCADSSPLSTTYTITQADIDNGALTNTATVTADTPPGVPSISETGSETLAGPDQLPALTVVKSETSGANFSAVGDQITYDYVVTNAGNITIDQQISVADDQTTVSCPATPSAGIAPGATLTCTSVYTVTQADLDAGQVVNVASASVSQPVVPSSTYPGGVANVTSPQVSETVQASQQPALSITKRIQPGTSTTYDAPGNLSNASDPNNLIFEFIVTNSGNVTTTAPITVDDAAIPVNITCTTAPLAPGEQAICQATWAPDQTDVDNGSFTNSATASTVFDGSTVTTPTPGEATAFAVQRPEISIAKAFVSITNGVFDVGNVATYEFTVTNTGNTSTLGPVTVNDNLIGAISCGTSALAPGDVVTCQGTYTITQDDFDLGSVTNIASGTDGTTTSDPTSETIPVDANPAISIDKIALAPVTATQAGDTIDYQFTITNTSPGNGTVRPALGPSFTIDDDKIGSFTCSSGSALQPDASFSCTATYTVTQADVDAVSGTGPDGFVTNNATGSTVFGSTDVVSPPDQVTVNLSGSPALEVVKTATNQTDPGQPADVGDTLNFAIQVSNTGNQTISNVIVTDPMLTNLTCPPGSPDPNNLTIAPNSQITCNGTYVVTQGDLDGQSIANTANASGSTPSGGSVTDDGSTTYPPATPNPSLNVTKEVLNVSPFEDFSTPGQQITFRVTVLNDGNITINGVEVTDSIVPGTCAIGTLAPGDSNNTCEFIYTVTQQDVDNGGVNNTATATGEPASAPGTTTTGTGSTTATGPTAQPAIGLSKEGTAPLAGNLFDAPGQTITYLYTVANLGNVTLTQTPTVVDDRITSVVCDPMPADGLAPGEELQCTGSYVTDQDDVDAGFVTNIADATMTNEYGGPDLTATQTETIDATRTTGLTIDKVASNTTNVMVGDTITYTYTVTNTGNVRLTDVTLDDQHTSASGTTALAISPSNVIAVMQPAEVVTLTSTYTITQDDIDAGTAISNTVSVTTTSPPGTTPPEGTATEEVTLETGDGALTVIKTLPAPPASLIAGTDLVFRVEVANTGNVTLSAPVLTDSVTQVGATAPLPTNPPAIYQSGDGGTIGELEVGETWVYEVTYQLTQSDVDAGGISNSVLAEATDPQGNPVTDVSDNGTGGGDDPTVVTITPAGSMELIKTVRTAPANPAAGDTVVFEVTVLNDGNVTLTTPNLVEDLRRADTTPVDVQPDAFYESGDGDNDSALDVGETWIFTISYVLTQDDIDAGGLSNSVTATANDPSGTPVTDTSDNGTGGGDDPTPLVITADPQLEVIKSVATAPPTPPQVGDIVGFEITVANTGNVTLSTPVLTDTLTPNGGVPVTPAPFPQFDSGDTNADTNLSVGETWVYILDYELTQADIDAGGISNTVLAEATDPSGTPVDDISDNGSGGGSTPTTVTLPADPEITAVKTILNAPIAAGDVVEFNIAVTNTGNVTLTGVGVTSDTLERADMTPLTLTTGPDYLAADSGSVQGTLIAGETATYRATYVLTQADIDAGGISNSATVSGTPPTGPPVTDISGNGTGGPDDPTVLDITPTPAMTVSKTLASGGPTFDAVGDVLTYEFEVVNTGNVTLDPISINDPLITNAGGTITCPPTLLGPGDSLTCSGSYTITQADLDAGQVDNTASATDGTTTSPPDSETVLAQQNPALATDKAAVSVEVDGTVYPGVPSERYVVGAIVTYEYTVSNTGNVTITQPVSVSDNLIASVNCPALPATGLAPGADLVCTGTYTVTSDDVSLGSTTNLASATDGTTTSPITSETVPANGQPSLETVKTLLDVTNPDSTLSAGLGYDEVGDVLRYQFTVTNTGQVSFADPVTVSDTRIPGAISCFAPTAADPDLRPGESVTCEATYTVNQADLDAQTVVNEAFAETTFGGGTPVVSPPATETADVDAMPSVAVSKSAATLPLTGVGQVLTYTITVENTGNQTLQQVEATDPLLPGLVCEAASLAPGAVLTCADDYTVTQADIDAGSVVNTADVTAITPAGGAVTDTTSLTVDAPPPAPALEVEKIASIEPFGPAGSTIQYTFAVTNTGNVTLSNVQIEDAILTPAYTCTIATLAVGETNANCLMSYTVTQGDVDAGEVVNTVDVTATGPNGGVATATDTLLTEGMASAAELNVTKLAALSGPAEPGAVINYQLVVQNTGNVTVTPSGVSDVMTRADGTPIALDVPFAFTGGDSNNDGRIALTETWTYEATYTLTQADIDAGGVSNSATVDGTAPNGTLVSDTSDDGDDGDGNSSDDPTEILVPEAPGVVAVKTATTGGAVAGDTIEFEIAVTNTGNVSLLNVTVADNLTNNDGADISAGVIGPNLRTTPQVPGALQPAETWVYDVSYVLTQADVDSGGVSNSAVIDAVTSVGTPVTDISDSGDPGDGPGNDDPTSVTITAAPSVEVTKLAGAPVRAGEGLFDVTFTLQAENTGNVTLGELSMVDDLVAFAAPATVVAVTTPTSTGFVSGGASASFDGISDTEALAPGSAIAPGQVGEVVFTVTLDVTDGSPGQPNIVLFNADRIAGEVSADVSIATVAAADLEMSKSVSPRNAMVGDIVTYTLRVQNNGSFNENGLTLVDEMPSGLVLMEGTALINGSATPEPEVSGRNLLWQPLDLPAGQAIEVTFEARIVDGPGELTNRAYIVGPDGRILSNIATATIQIRPEAVFDCGDVIGRVFDDRNMNGYQDGVTPFEEERSAGVTDQTYDSGKFTAPPEDPPEAEPGLSNARVVTVDGTVITTDEYGRFSVPCAALPANIGSNFTLKLDETSLPTGYQVTSENPRTVRLTPGTMARMNFGAALADVIDVALTEHAFVNGQPRAALAQGIDALAFQMGDAPTMLRLTYMMRGEGANVARARLDMVEQMIRERWTGSGRNLTIERTIAEGQ